MPIDVERVLGAELPELAASWTPDDVILYHLGVGAGGDPIDQGELRYVYERDLTVLPSYAVVPAMPALFGMLELPGMNVDLATLLHGEQELVVHEPLPPDAAVITSGRVTEIFDKGKAALVVLETTTFDAADERPLFTNRWSAFFRGEGGFGGPAGPAAAEAAPERDPDHLVDVSTLPQQGLLYRLSGDKNPLHVDPEFAAQAGFERPILHGLCTFGIVLKAVIDTALAGDAETVASYRARFAGVLYPGESLQVAVWDDGDRLLVAARCAERDVPVLSHAVVTKR